MPASTKLKDGLGVLGSYSVISFARLCEERCCFDQAPGTEKWGTGAVRGRMVCQAHNCPMTRRTVLYPLSIV